MLKRISYLITGFLLVGSCATVRPTCIEKGINIVGKKYEVVKDVNLKGSLLEIPEGYTLIFKGGKLHDGKILMHNTRIEGLSEDIFERLSFSGTTRCTNIESSCFGLKPELDSLHLTNQQTAFDCMSDFINCMSDCTLSFQAGYYGFGGEGSVQKHYVGNKNYGTYRFYALLIDSPHLKSLIINGNGAAMRNLERCHYGAWSREGDSFEYVKTANSDQLHNETTGGGFLYVDSETMKYVSISALTVNYNTLLPLYGGHNGGITHAQNAFSFRLSDASVVIRDCKIENNLTDGILFRNRQPVDSGIILPYRNISIANVSIYNSGRSGISIAGSKNVQIEKTSIVRSGNIDQCIGNFYWEGPGCSIDFEPSNIGDICTDDIFLRDCRFEDALYCNLSFATLPRAYNKRVTIERCEFRNSHILHTVRNGEYIIPEGTVSPVYAISGGVWQSLDMVDCNLICTGLNLGRFASAKKRMQVAGNVKYTFSNIVFNLCTDGFHIGEFEIEHKSSPASPRILGLDMTEAQNDCGIEVCLTNIEILYYSPWTIQTCWNKSPVKCDIITLRIKEPVSSAIFLASRASQIGSQIENLVVVNEVSGLIEDGPQDIYLESAANRICYINKSRSSYIPIKSKLLKTK